jgi:uncharacterized protein YggT (Ycf19 family)
MSTPTPGTPPTPVAPGATPAATPSPLSVTQAATSAPPPSHGLVNGTNLLKVARWAVMFVYAIALIAIVILTIAFFLKLFGASTTAPFTEWVYRSSDRFMQPFRGIFPSVEVSDKSVLDVSLLFGMLMYTLFALAVHALVEWLDRKLYRASVKDSPAAQYSAQNWR